MNKITLEQDLTLPILARLGRLEYRLCIGINRLSGWRLLHGMFRTVSRLGDGVFWYCLMAALALFGGEAGREAALRMGIAGLAGLLIYRQLKHRLVRERPFITYQDIRCGCPPLDRFSFPSGHTLHAVTFTTLALAYFPLLAPVLVPFAALVALSRPVLGLHYPSDVLCGALIGYSVAQLVLWV